MRTSKNKESDFWGRCLKLAAQVGSLSVIMGTALNLAFLPAARAQTGGCTPKSNTTYEWIAGVTIGEFTNTSGPSQYSDFKPLGPTVSNGTSDSIPVTLIPGYSGAAYRQRWQIFVDMNDDGIFSSNERVVHTTGVGAVSAELPIENLPTGQLAMRVIANFGAPVGACSSNFYGEAEDYMLTITGNSNGDDPAESTISAVIWGGSERFLLPQSQVLTPQDGSFAVIDLYPGASSRGVMASFDFATTDSSIVFTFAPPENAALTRGLYRNVRQYPNTNWLEQDLPGLDVTRIRNGAIIEPCNTTSGEFDVLDYKKDDSGAVVAFAARFHHICDDQQELHGKFYFNYSMPELCEAAPRNSAEEWIDSIGIGATKLQIGSRLASNVNFTELKSAKSFIWERAVADRGASVDFVLTPGFKNHQYSEHWQIFVDKNKDGQYSTDELAYASNRPVSGAVTARLELPADFPALTTARVVMQYRPLKSSEGCQSVADRLTWGQSIDVTLEQRKVCDFNPVHQNPNNRYDVNGDGSVTALDALTIINFMNTQSQQGESKPFLLPLENTTRRYTDVDGDGCVDEKDSNAVIAYLNRQ